MADTKLKKKNTNNTSKKTAGKTLPKKSSSGKATKSNGSSSKKKITKEEKLKLEKIERRQKRINHLILAVVLLALSMFLIISMYTNVAGIIGRGINFIVLGLFGKVGYGLPFYFLIYSVLLIVNLGSKKGKLGTILFTIGFFILISSVYSINKLGMAGDIASFGSWMGECFSLGTKGSGGGFIGMTFAFILTKVIGKGGAYIITIACMLIAIVVTMNRPFEWIFNLIIRLINERKKKNINRRKKAEKKKPCEQIVFYGDFDENFPNEYGFDIDDCIYMNSSNEYETEAENDESVDNEANSNDSADEKTDNKKRIIDLMKSDGILKKSVDSTKNEKSKSSEYGLYEDLIDDDNIRENNINDDITEDDFDFNLDELKSIKYIYNKKSNEFENNAHEGFDYDDIFEDDYSDKDKSENAPYVDLTKNGGNDSYDGGLSEKVSKGAYNADKSDVLSLPKKIQATKSIINDIGGRIKSGLTESAGKNNGLNSFMNSKIKSYNLPPISLLKGNHSTVRSNEAQELNQKAALLENTLKSFNVNAKVIKVSRGPAVTRFEVQPATGVKVNSIVRLQDDIALNLEARSIRLEAPIPGKAAVGIEIENEEKKAVLLREVVESDEFKFSDSKITFAVGRDISGNSIVANLKDMPHLLIAGSTGSGKSVCVNSIIMSILYKASPDEVKLILVDPKVVELSNYNGIPHLLIPVVTEASKAAVALNWAVKEMEERYKKFQEIGVRELSSYNRKAERVKGYEKMPQIVIIIDELADLMMAAPQQVEDAICRLAQKARAAGMHLIVATQRPSVDVITGVIKANIPSRIAFAVSSQIDSRTILDGSGAEKLVGKGDMLFSPLGMGKPLRVQGTFVSDEEVQAVIEYVSGQGHEQEFSNDLMDTIETSKMTYNDDEVDELLMDAIEHIVNVGQASVSMLQRRFRIGYNRAARLVDMMEERGIVGPQDGSRPRKVFLTKEGLAELDRSINNSSFKTFNVKGEASASNDDAVPEEI